MSTVGLAMSQQRLDLQTAEQSLLNWRSAIAREYEDDIRALIIRVVIVAAAILLIVFISEFWRRATFKYVHDVRRRRGLMMVRRIVMGFFVLLVIIASFVTEIGSLATFAGLITAGIAVSLQTVILSGVAYFFFIGRFGVRVGDRVTISGITGDVVEVGLFRLYLMELSGKAGDLHSTGRMIVFSNAVVFQPSAFYKQLPGTDYVWHEVAMTLTPDGDHVMAENRLMSAVQSVFETYRPAVESQYRDSMQTLHVTLEPPRPEGRLRFVDAGVEYVIRYPVELDQASQIDDRVTRALLDTINQEPKLKFASAATPRIQVTG
jgi:small-conductance mechanosensitive channel